MNKYEVSYRGYKGNINTDMVEADNWTFEHTNGGRPMETMIYFYVLNEGSRKTVATYSVYNLVKIEEN